MLPAAGAAIASSLFLAFGAGGFGVLLAGRLLYGLSMGAIMSPGSVWLQELSPPGAGPRRATLALSAGFGAGPLVAGLLVEFAPWPMVLPYVVHALTMALALVVARSSPETASPKPQGTPEAARRLSRDELGLLTRLSVMAPWVFAFAAVTVAIVPGLLRAHVARPALFAGASVVVTLFTGVLVQRWTGRLGPRADRIGLALGGAGIFVASFAVARGVPALALASGVLLGAGYGLVVTAGLREIEARVAPERRGKVVGVYYVLTYVGFALPFVHALVARHLGDVLALRLTACLTLASLAIRLGARPKVEPRLLA